jgi:hypothetical protein
MSHKSHGLVAVAALLAAACSQSDTTATDASALASTALSASFASTPVGYGELTSSFVGSTAAAFSDASLWIGGGRGASLGSGVLMGGGLGDAFVGGIAFGHGGHGGPFGGGLGCTGTFNATTGRVECAAETRNGITVTRSAAYTNAAGQVQQAFDTLTTNTVNIQTAASGTVSYDRAADTVGGHHGWGHGRGNVGRLLGDTSTILTASVTVQSASNRTVAGLASGSTQRTVNGTSRGTEATTGTSSRGAFTASRVFGDTTTGVIVPVRAATDTTKTYPTAGTVIRVVNASLTYTGQTALTLSRREVVTYNGTTTATVTITENGATKTCTRTLPRGALTCP